MSVEQGDLGEFGADARRAVRAAEGEARDLGHDRVGTEHLLLGLMADDVSRAAQMLADAGTTVAAVRTKITEAVGGSRGGVPPHEGTLPRTARANRALGRSVRFARSRNAGIVSSEHLLWGVLDVEGTAGQALRGLGVDIEQLRAALESLETSEPDTGADEPADKLANDVGRAPLVHTTCPVCFAAVDHGGLVVHVMTARGDGDETSNALVFSCGECRTVLGVAPA